MMKWTPFFALMLVNSTYASTSETPWGTFLTWQRDPSSTMTIQWLERGAKLAPAHGQKETADPYQVGYLNEAGDENALWQSGYAIEFLASPENQRFAPADFSAVGRLAWNTTGLAIGIKVNQTDFSEAQDIRRLWSGSSVEIVVSPEGTGKPAYHFALAPGLDPDAEGIRVHHYSPALAQPTIKVTPEPTGYQLFVEIPWDALPMVNPQEGSELRVQFYLNQGLRPHTRRIGWYLSNFSGLDSRFAHKIVLSPTASSPYRLTGQLEKTPDGGVCIISALPEDAGKQVAIKAGEVTLGTATLELIASDYISTARLPVPLPQAGHRWGPLEVILDGQTVASVEPTLAPSDFQSPEAKPLHYGIASGEEALGNQYQQSTVSPLSFWPGVFLHRIELTDLQPDTRYAFQPQGVSEPWYFQTMPQQLNRPVRIALGGDTLHQQEWMAQTTRTAIEQSPDLIIWGGDLADSNAQPEAVSRWVQWFAALDAAFDTESRQIVPILVALGNHDVNKGYYYKHPEYQQTDAWRKRIAPEFYELFAFPSQPGYGVLDFGDYLSVIILDSNHTNPIDGTQAGWLEKTLQERSQNRHVLPIYHVPAYPSVKDYNNSDSIAVRQHWAPLFDRYHIPTAFEHHNHAYKRTHPITAESINAGGTVYFGDGAWGVTPRPVHDPEQTWYLKKAFPQRHAILLTLTGNEQQFQVISGDGTLLDEHTVPVPMKEANVSMNAQD